MVTPSSHTPPDDPRLTAYLLDELEPAERVAFEVELEANPTLKAQLAELRKVSSALGRAFREESLPDLSAAPAIKRKRSTTVPALSPNARAARIARLKQDAPKLGKPRKNRFNSLFLAAAASVALMGVFILQQVDEFSQAKKKNPYVLVGMQEDEDYKNEKPLEERIEDTLLAERAEADAAFDAVAEKVARGLDLALGGEPEKLTSAMPEGLVSLADAEAVLFAPDAPDLLAPASPAVTTLSQVARGKTQARPAAMAAVTARSIKSSGYRSPGSMARQHVDVRGESASYGQVRSAIRSKRWPSLHEVKIDELINYFEYAEEERARQPAKIDPSVGVDLEVGQAPWEPVHYLVRVTVDTAESSEAVQAAVRFNPTQVAAYRLLGYENGELHEARPNAETLMPSLPSKGELTALYEVVPVGAPTLIERQSGDGFVDAPIAPYAHEVSSSEILWMEVRFEPTGSGVSRREDFVLHAPARVPGWRETSRCFRWAAAVASFGMELKDDPLRGGLTWDLVEALARSVADFDRTVEQLEFIELINDARSLDPGNNGSNG